MLNNINFCDLETKGYVVIPNFVDVNIINQIISHYNKIHADTDYTVSTQQFITNDIKLVLELITQNTDITVNLIRTNTGFFNNHIIKYDYWHTDCTPFYMWQDYYNSINCWIPLIKPNPDQSGIDIIPHDILSQQYPDIYKNNIKGYGAQQLFAQDDGTSILKNNNNGTNTLLPFNIDKFSVSPTLNVGDLLIMRHDVFHKTQDAIDYRLAMSIRCFNGNTILTRDKFLTSCDYKHSAIKNKPILYTGLNQKFIVEKLETVKIAEFKDLFY
jgi:hypothetical protein